MVTPMVEVCNDSDDDCDGYIDEDDPELTDATTYYIDVDGDGYGEEGGEGVAACEAPDGYVENDVDCDDDNADVHPDADELYAWTFRRDCGADVYCTEVAAECPGLFGAGDAPADAGPPEADAGPAPG